MYVPCYLLWRLVTSLLTWHKQVLTKIVGLSTNYQTPFAVRRCDSCFFFFRSDGAVKPPPARFRAFQSPLGNGLTLALMGSWEPPSFFPDYQKTAACSTAVFGTPYHASFSHMTWKISDRGYARSGHQFTSKYLTSKKFEWSSKLHRLNHCLETFSNWYKQQCT